MTDRPVLERNLTLDYRMAEALGKQTCRDVACKGCGKFSYLTDWVNHSPLPRYSKNVKDFWSVVNSMKAKGWFCILDTECSGAMFFKPNELGHKPFDGLNTGGVWVVGPTMPEAVCNAALRALEK